MGPHGPHLLFSLSKLLYQYLLSLNHAVSVNSYYYVNTLNRSWNSCTGRCKVSYRNNLCTLNKKVRY